PEDGPAPAEEGEFPAPIAEEREGLALVEVEGDEPLREADADEVRADEELAELEDEARGGLAPRTAGPELDRGREHGRDDEVGLLPLAEELDREGAGRRPIDALRSRRELHPGSGSAR